MNRLLLVLACVLVVGCGSDEAADDPLAALDAAAKKTKAAESNRQEFTMESDLGGQEFSATGEGTVSADNDRGHMTFEMQSADVSGKFEAITSDGAMYIKSDTLPLPKGKEWLKTEDPPTSTLSPSEFVQFLVDSGKVENEGTEEIRGEETVHFSGPLDLDQLAQASGSEIADALRRAPEEAKKMRMQVDVWVGPNGLPARMALDMSSSEAEGSLKMTGDILEYNVEVEAEPPPASKVFTP